MRKAMLGLGLTLWPTLLLAATFRFDATLLNGEHFHHDKSHVLLVNYWATDCDGCRQEMPVLDALYRKYHARGLDIIGVNVDGPSALPQVRRQANAMSYPMALYEQVTQAGASRVWATPMTYLVDTQGRLILDGQPGYQVGDSAQLERQIQQTLHSANL